MTARYINLNFTHALKRIWLWWKSWHSAKKADCTPDIERDGSLPSSPLQWLSYATILVRSGWRDAMPTASDPTFTPCLWPLNSHDPQSSKLYLGPDSATSVQQQKCRMWMIWGNVWPMCGLQWNTVTDDAFTRPRVQTYRCLHEDILNIHNDRD